MKKRTALTHAVVGILLLVVGIGCSGYGDSGRSPPGLGETFGEGVAEQYAVGTDILDTDLPIIRVCVLDDRSGSAIKNLIEPMTERQVERLIDGLMQTGGEIGYQTVDAASDEPLHRLVINPPPSAPEIEDTSGNVVQALIDAGEAQRRAEKHEKLREQWSNETRVEVDKFMAVIRPLLRLEPGGYTDVHEGVRRCDAMLREPRDVWATPPKLVMLINSDGEHTVEGITPVTEIQSDAELVAVNGRAIFGDLPTLHPVLFEGLDAAIAYVIVEEEREDVLSGS